MILTTVPPAPHGLLAAANVDLPQVTDHLLDQLGSEDDAVRAAAAAAAEQLLLADPQRVIALGPALASNCQDAGPRYAGEPDPTRRAARALAAAWCTEPANTVAIIESAATNLSESARAALMRVVHFVRRPDESTDIPVAASHSAIGFCARRLSGDWGDRATDQAITALTGFVDDAPELLSPHVHTLVGTLLRLTTPAQPSPVLQDPTDPLAAIEREGTRIALHSRQGAAARLLGRLAAQDPAAGLPPVLTMFNAETGDVDQDTAIRVALLTALAEAAHAASLRDLWPIVCSALVSAHPRVRAGAIGLWAHCAAVDRDAVPEDLAYLAEAVLTDRYVIVHQAVLDRLPPARSAGGQGARLPADGAPMGGNLRHRRRTTRGRRRSMVDAVSGPPTSRRTGHLGMAGRRARHGPPGRAIRT